MNVVSISGSPSARSRSAWLLRLAQTRLESLATSVRWIAVRELPPVALLRGDAAEPAIASALQTVQRADVVLVATPIYKAAYSGLLKLLFDLLPQDGLRGKTVLPIATAGSPAHLLALDYALKPVLSSMGARDILTGVFATDSQLRPHATQGYVADDAIVDRLDRSINALGDRAFAESAPDFNTSRCLPAVGG